MNQITLTKLVVQLTRKLKTTNKSYNKFENDLIQPPTWNKARITSKKCVIHINTYKNNGESYNESITLMGFD